MKRVHLFVLVGAVALPGSLVPAAAGSPVVAPDVGVGSSAVAVIKGKVNRPNGRKIAGITVLAYPKQGTRQGTEPLAETTTNSKGKYRLDLSPGGYRVLADGYGKLRTSQWFDDSATLDSSRRVRARGVVKRVSFTLSNPAGEIPEPILPTNTPASPGFAGLPVDEITSYEPQKECRTQPRPGTVALRELLLATYGEDIPAYMNRECLSDTSEHYDGRAIDWMVDSRDRNQASKGDAFVQWLLATRDGEPAAMARRLGVMYLVWRGRIWGQYRLEDGWREYNDCSQAQYRSPEYDNTCHRNHIHISLNHDGAEQRTSWYQAGG
ncbi:MAG: carboxypeptidase regulatory-like domain-containing protein [Actinobacteria bacterium]|nr:carboxypeptidase regulatory-like domain-containing protein [Actinomycetota bacterium]